MKEKGLLVLHIRNLEENTLAKTVYEEQKSKKWPGLAQETANICRELGIEDCNFTLMSKGKYVKILQEALHKKNEEMLRIFAKGKCERTSSEKYGRKEYIEEKKYF